MDGAKAETWLAELRLEQFDFVAVYVGGSDSSCRGKCLEVSYRAFCTRQKINKVLLSEALAVELFAPKNASVTKTHNRKLAPILLTTPVNVCLGVIAVTSSKHSGTTNSFDPKVTYLRQ